MSFLKIILIYDHASQPDLNEALFVKRSGTKKREWKAEKAAPKKITAIIGKIFANQVSNKKYNYGITI